VQDALYAVAHPRLSSKAATIGGKAVSQVIKKFFGIETDKLGVIEELLPDIKAKLVVFDADSEVIPATIPI
jgi:hypothetical protein